MTESNVIQTQVQLTAEQDRQLEHLAVTMRISKAELIRHAVELLLRNHASSHASEEQRRRALAVIGCFRSNDSDVARNHDIYLAEAYGTDQE